MMSTDNMEVTIAAEQNGEEMEDEENRHTTAVEVEQYAASSYNSTECRICQAEDSLDLMEAPCGCNGTLKFAHRECIQRWVNSRYKTTCEICNQPYESGYRVNVQPPAPSRPTAREVEDARRVMAEVEAAHAAAARAEVYLARLNEANTAFLGRTALCRAALVIVFGFYILIVTSNGGDAFHFRIERTSPPPSPAPSASQPDAPSQLTITLGAWPLWG